MQSSQQGVKAGALRLKNAVWSLPTDRKVDLVLEGLRGDRPVVEICREAGISPRRYCQWRDQFIQAGQAGLTYAKLDCHALEERVQQLEAENVGLRREMRTLQELCLAD